MVIQYPILHAQFFKTLKDTAGLLNCAGQWCCFVTLAHADLEHGQKGLVVVHSVASATHN